MGNCTNCTESCACCEYVDVADKVLWRELKGPRAPRIWKIKRLLTRNGASPNATQRDARGRRDTILHAAVRLGAFAIVDEIVTQGATLELPSEVTDSTPMMHAVQRGRKDMIRFFVEMNLNLSYAHNGETTLTWVAKQPEHWHLLPEILANVGRQERGERLRGTNGEGLNALQVCIRDRLREPWDVFSTFGFPLDAETSRGSPSLHYSVEIDRMEGVARLLDEGASIGGRDALRRTPLLVAVIVRNARAVELLLDFISRLTAGSRHARMNDCDKAGNTAVHYATCNSRGGILGLLLEAGAEPDTKNKQELAPVHIAASEGNAPCISALIDFGADFEALDCQGKSPIHRALAHGHLAVVGVLLEHGARSVGFALDGSTPLMAAQESYLLGSLSHGVLKRIDQVEAAYSLNEAVNKNQKELDRLHRRKRKQEEMVKNDVKKKAARKKQEQGKAKRKQQIKKVKGPGDAYRVPGSEL